MNKATWTSILITALSISLPAQAGEWDNQITFLSNHIYRGFSYSGERPGIQAQSNWSRRNFRLEGIVSPLSIDGEDGLDKKLGVRMNWTVLPNLEMSTGIQHSHYDGLLPELTELTTGLTWRRGNHYTRVEAFGALGNQVGSRHVDIELGWFLPRDYRFAMAWGNTRSFAYLDKNDHDYYRFELNRSIQRGQWTLRFERAYDTGFIKSLSNEHRLMLSYTLDLR